MKNMILILIAAGSLTSCQKDKENTDPSSTTYEKSVMRETFGEKEWSIISIVTTPAVMDINGDGKNEAELISTLQEGERNKKLVFAPDGKVWEKRTSKGETTTTENGKWQPGEDGDIIVWKQSDGTILVAETSEFSGNTVKFSYKQNDVEMMFTLESR
jgi:hypothetical protein